MERKLASIQTVIDIQPIEGADAIEVATVLGWKVVVKKNQFKVGSKVIYVEVDSILPELPEFEFLRAKHFRIKTIKLRGQISQGICFPIETVNLHNYQEVMFAIGTDLTEKMGILKYEPQVPANLAGTVKGSFPSFIPKTDEIRIQTVPAVLQRHKGKKFYLTEKLDGSSCTMYFKDGEFGVCSRNLDLIETEGNAFWRAVRKHGWQDKIEALRHSFDIANIAVQGELIGNGIQGNKYKLGEPDVYVFNIFDIDKHSFFDFCKLQKAREEFEPWGFNFVPILSGVELNHTVDDLVAFSIARSILNPEVWREGIVLKPFEEERDEVLGRLSFKVINPEFLLKHNE